MITVWQIKPSKVTNTLGWYVDDNKVSHVNDDMNTMIVDAIEE